MGRFVLILALVVVTVGCGSGSDDGSDSTGAGSGAEVWAKAGCGSCHTFAAASSNGAVGPNLDDLKPSFDQVKTQVENGGGGMPSFKSELSKQEIEEVSRYVSSGGKQSAGSGQPVLATFKPDTTRLDGCIESDCRRQAFGNIAYKDGPKKALDLFDEKQLTDKAVESDCHRIAHWIGAASLLYYHGNVAQALAAGRATCWSGYYHGVVERAFQGTPPGKLADKTRAICSGADVRKTTFLAYQCVHGLGHGLMIHTGYDLPFALKTCNQLTTAWDDDSCESGVFMENISSSYGIKSKWLKGDDLLYPCDVVAQKYKLYCYLIVTSRILEANGFNWEGAVKTCRRSDKGWVATCFQSLGRDASGNTRQDPTRILQICSLAGNMERECVYGAARDVTSNDASPRRSKGLCEQADRSLQAYCFEGIGTIVGGMHAYRDERRAACRQITERYFLDCARGAVAD